MVDANILFKLGAPANVQTAMQSAAQAQGTLNELAQMPIRNRLLEAQAQGADLQNQKTARAIKDEDAMFVLRDVALDAMDVIPIIKRGNMAEFSAFMDGRIRKIEGRDGDATESRAFKEQIESGLMSPDVALERLQGAVEKARQAGVLEGASGMTEFQRENLALQRRRLDLAENLSPAQAASIDLARQRIELASDVGLEERKAEAGALGRAKGETKAEKIGLASSDAPVLFSEFISAIQQQPETGIGRAYESRAGFFGLGNVEQQRAIAVADTIASQLMAYANKLPGPASDKDRVDFKASIGAYESASNREQRLAAAQQAQKSFMRLVKKYGAQQDTEIPPPVPPESQQVAVDTQSTDKIASPKTQADYDELPSGAIFIDPDDGKQYRKP